MLLLRNVEYCKSNKKFIKPIWLQKDIYDIEIPSDVIQKIDDKTDQINSSININTSINKGFLDRIEVSLPANSENTFPKSVKIKSRKTKLNDKTSTKMSTMSTMNVNSRKQKPNSKTRKVSR